jgi:amidophosphoribosyltransferase
VEEIKHECGLALVRLRKPLNYYSQKYGTPLWGLQRLYILLEKQKNRGQDGAGAACVKLQMPPGKPFVALHKLVKPSPPWSALIEVIQNELREQIENIPNLLQDINLLKENFSFSGELLIGHLRYATHGKNTVDYCHPVFRANGWKSKNLLLAGNFNLTNVDFLLNKLIALGQHPTHLSDTVTMLERMGHFLDQENEQLFRKFKNQGYKKAEISPLIAAEIDLLQILAKSAKHWDGGFTIGGIIGSGDIFFARDPWGIRPAYYYYDDEIALMASERQAIAAALGIDQDKVQELQPAYALAIKADNRLIIAPYMEARQKKSCVFERIYFSRGADSQIYKERKMLGQLLVPYVLKAIDNDFENTVFSYIPNTAQIAFLGLLAGLEARLNALKIEAVLQKKLPPEELIKIMQTTIRAELVIEKETRLRTFIADPLQRNSMAANVYDICQGTLRPYLDTLVCIDDSIVRGTTLSENILRNLARLKPKKIIIVSSAPQIRYPDCYGIDMSQIDQFIAFQAAINLLKETNRESIIHQTYQACQALRSRNELTKTNLVKAIYEPFTEEDIAKRISIELSRHISDCPVEIIFQPTANLALAMPNHTGDWYFTGDYPTPGGNKVVNQAFINYYEGIHERAYA